jgi:uncharacterized membrane protein YdjX (TVP38/TMEM64 family)
MAQQNDEKLTMPVKLFPSLLNITTYSWWKTARNIFVVLVVVMALGLIGWLLRVQALQLFAILSDQETVSAQIQGYGIWGPLVLGASHYLQVIVAFIPGHVFVVAGGYVYGFPLGLTLNMLFVVLASQTGFYIAKVAGRPIVGKFVDAATLDKWEAIAEKRGILFFTIAFILPVFPSDSMNFVAGLTGMSGRKFLIANFFGRLPSVTLLTLVGSHGLQFSNYTWGLLAVGVVLIYIIGRYTILKVEQQYRNS